MTGLEVYNNGDTQFTTKYPAILVDRTNNYGYKNFILTFTTDPALPTPPPSTAGGNISVIYLDLFKIYHGLGYVPSFQSVTIGYGLPSNGGIAMWNEDALLSFTNNGFNTTAICNYLTFRSDENYLYVKLFRESQTAYSLGFPVLNPPSLAGVQLNINTQIFAMGVNDTPSIVL